MGINPELQIIIKVFIVFLTVHFFKVSANENSEGYVPCKPGWYVFGDKCYKIFGLNIEQLTWWKSQQSCLSHGGNLASIHSRELQEFLIAFVLLNSKSDAWIGLHDQGREGIFSWVDSGDPNLNYTNWDEGAPTKSRLNLDDCVKMSYSIIIDRVGTWKDEACSNLNPYICEVAKNNDTKSPDPRFCSIEDGGGWKYLNSCYHIVKEERTWEDAEKYCEEKYKGYLVTILDDKVEVFLNHIERLSKFSQNVWIGIKFGNYSRQKWASGWHVANKIQEMFPKGNDRCVVKSNWNCWVTFRCQIKLAFICERIKYNVPVLQRPPSDDWKCPYSEENWLDLGGDSCYYIENESKRNWFDANYECGRKGGTLATFHSENETNILHHHVLGTQERLLIGIRRNYIHKDVFEWADGTKVEYQNWLKGEPNNPLLEMCGELYTESMKWNDVACNKPVEEKGYICKTKKVFSYSKYKDILDQVPSNSAFSKDQTYPSGIPEGTMVVTVFCGFLIGILVGVLVHRYRDYLKGYCTKFKKDCTSTTPGSLGHVSEKVFWKEQEEGLPY